MFKLHISVHDPEHQADFISGRVVKVGHDGDNGIGRDFVCISHGVRHLGVLKLGICGREMIQCIFASIDNGVARWKETLPGLGAVAQFR